MFSIVVMALSYVNWLEKNLCRFSLVIGSKSKPELGMAGFPNTFNKQITPQQHLIIGGLFLNLVKQERTIWDHVTAAYLFILFVVLLQTKETIPS